MAQEPFIYIRGTTDGLWTPVLNGPKQIPVMPPLTGRSRLSQSAIVLVDVWQRHYLKDTEARAEDIIKSNLVPLLAACRKAGINIIHAPSPEVAALHPNWVKIQSKAELEQKRDDWPPVEFLNSTGPYKSFAMPFEPREEERNNLPALTFHPLVKPVGKEPVIATGEELHRYCKRNGILFLLFAGLQYKCMYSCKGLRNFADGVQGLCGSYCARLHHRDGIRGNATDIKPDQWRHSVPGNVRTFFCNFG